MTFKKACKLVHFPKNAYNCFIGSNRFYWFQKEFVNKFLASPYFPIYWKSAYNNQYWWWYYYDNNYSGEARLRWGGGILKTYYQELAAMKFLFQKRVREKYKAWLKLQQ